MSHGTRLVLMVPYNTPLHKSKQRWIMQIWLILTNYNELDDVEPKINEYSQVIGSRGWEWRPKKQEFLHFIFVLTYAAVYCRGPSKQAWLNLWVVWEYNKEFGVADSDWLVHIFFPFLWFNCFYNWWCI